MTKKSKGLGDTIEKITKATGIDKVAKAVLGDDCGCDERKEKLNKMFPYNKVRQFTEDELKIYEEMQDTESLIKEGLGEMRRHYAKISAAIGKEV